MGLRPRFNLTLLGVFIVGLVVAGLVSYDLLQRNARDEVVRSAQLMIQAARAVRTYTVDQVKPELAARLQETFLPQSVPAYAATEVVGLLPEQYRDFTYKEATLNPTNPRDRPTDWEADLIQAFRRDAGLTGLSGERVAANGRQLYIASPLRIAEPACLDCHSNPAVAPATMTDRYGDQNGFGWKLEEVVGAQIVSVPMSVPIANANRAFLTFMASLCAIFVVLFVALNLMLSRMIIRPIAEMSRRADAVSTGNFDIPEFPDAGRDEIAGLGRSFNRMRRSLEQAMKMID
jgi:protein-histidine pros-kinase